MTQKSMFSNLNEILRKRPLRPVDYEYVNCFLLNFTKIPQNWGFWAHFGAKMTQKSMFSNLDEILRKRPSSTCRLRIWYLFFAKFPKITRNLGVLGPFWGKNDPKIYVLQLQWLFLCLLKLLMYREIIILKICFNIQKRRNKVTYNILLL